MSTIKITLEDKVYEEKMGITIDEFLKKNNISGKYPILLAKVDNRLKELDYKVLKDRTITPLDLTSQEGNKALISGLVFVLFVSIKELFGNSCDILVEHSIDKGLYIKTNFELNNTKLKQIKEKMNNIIKENREIKKVIVDRIDVINYYKALNDISKVDNLRYNVNNYINLYKLGKYYDYYYTKMPLQTGLLSDFKLNYINEHGLVLGFPTIYSKDYVPVYHNHPNMFKVFKDYKDWTILMHLENASNLNKMVSESKIYEIIRICENKINNEIYDLAKKIVNDSSKKIILMAGPSSSGKTTSSKKLCMALRSLGKNPTVIGMDNYFVEREETPRDEKGEYDYECLEAIDLKLFDKQIEELLDGKKVLVPTYNFLTGKKEYKNELTLNKDDVIVIEGIHALDTKVLTNVDKNNIYKIYVSALTELNIDNHNRVSTTDNRLLRRLIRDSGTRGHDARATLKSWASVRSGEEKYIFPYQDEADYTLNTSLLYEIGVLKTYAEPILFSVDENTEEYAEAKRLIDFLKNFLPIPADAIPADSIVREFIGGTCFKD